MNDGRLTIRFTPQYQQWIAALPGDEAAAVRSLMALGAALLGLEGAAGEALARLGVRLDREVVLWLLDMADARQPHGSHTAATRQPHGSQLADRADDALPLPTLAALGLDQEDEESDPFGAFGFDV